MIDPELAALMTQKVRSYAPGTRDAYGNISFAPSPVEMPCHIQGRVKEVLTRSGEVAVSTGQALLSDVYPALTDAHKLEVPSLSSPSGWRTVNIIAVITSYDEAGPYYQTIYYGEA